MFFILIIMFVSLLIIFSSCKVSSVASKEEEKQINFKNVNN